MKKLLLIALLLVAAVGMKADDQVTARVSGTTLNIALENATSYCAFQMDITLPEGVSATEVAAVANRLSQEGSDTEVGGTKFIVAHNTLAGNVLRVIAYNLANAQISNATGDILTITLSATVADPTVITVTNILFVNANDLSEVALNNATGEQGVLKGDVNLDGSVDALDMVRLINILLGKVDETPSANINGNGDVDALDLVNLINILLGK